MKIDAPGGESVDLHRRCWIGRGGTTAPATRRVQASELGYDSDLEFVFPAGLGVFKAGGDLSFHHGSTSLAGTGHPSGVVPHHATAVGGARSSCVARAGRGARRPTARPGRVGAVMVTAPVADGPLAVRVVLVSEQDQVGQAGMTIGAELDRTRTRTLDSPQDERSGGHRVAAQATTRSIRATGRGVRLRDRTSYSLQI